MLSLICGPGSRSRVFFLATHLRLLIGPSDSNKMLSLRTWVGGDLFPAEREPQPATGDTCYNILFFREDCLAQFLLTGAR